MLKVAQGIDWLNEWLGRLTSWLALAMVIMMVINVGMRYLLSSGDPWQQEIVRFMHGILFLAGAAFAFRHEALVRVDVLYQQMSARATAWVNIAGTFIFLFPMCAAIVWFSASYILGSWDILEGSNEYKGMPGVFVFKSFIWVMAFSLILQGISTVIHNIRVLQGFEPPVKHERL
jgi:TRAP-type mannitol/chloroaromatic compound transport system permease small subunit